MAVDQTVPDASVVLDLIEAFRRSKVMFAGVELGVFDELHRHAMSVDELSDTCKLDRDAAKRLLDALVALQLIVCNEGRYANTPAANAYLTSTSPRRFTGYIRYSNDMAWKLWANLEGAIRQGTHRWKETFGWDEPIFSNFFKTDEAKREFLMGMHGFGVLSSPSVVSAFDLSGFNTLVDLGAATGHLALAACERYPHLKAIVFDLPEAVPLAREIVGDSPYADRVHIVAGNFFEDPLPVGDLYALGRILHDWSEEKIRVLLKRIVEHLPKGGGLLIAEKMLLEDGTGPRWARMQDLNMLICTEGRERTLSEYEQLLLDAGFTTVTGCRTQAPIDAILAVK